MYLLIPFHAPEAMPITQVMRGVFIIALQTSIANAIDHAGDKAKMDRYAKSIFSHLCVLAPLMRMCIPEFAGMTDQYIIENCFVDTPQVSAYAVNQDENGKLDGNTKVTQMNSEDSSNDEKTILYDVRFTAKIPENEQLICLIINIEIQAIDRQKYKVVTRGIYYGARMISAQYGTVFTKRNYQNIQKVYSIWICPNSSRKQNSITSYQINEQLILGDASVNKRDYDKLQVIVVTMDSNSLDPESPGGNHPLIRFLSLLLSASYPVESRKSALEEEYRVELDESLEEEMNAMCNLGEGIALMYENKGKTQAEAMMKQLIDKLLKAGRINDISRIVNEPNYLEEQYKAFNITPQDSSSQTDGIH